MPFQGKVQIQLVFFHCLPYNNRWKTLLLEDLMEKKLLTIIIPCYNEEDSLPLLYDRLICIRNSLTGTNTEILFIDDGSTDNTLNCIKTFHKQDKQISFLSFSRNFGKEAAIYAGLIHAKGDYVVLLDADLQHPPEYIHDMFDLLEKGEYDCVAMYRSSRSGESKLRSFFSKCFYRLINKISQTNFVNGATDYRMMTRQVVDAVLSLPEYNRFTKGIFNWVGFRTHWIPYENVPRLAGKSKWSFFHLVLYSFEAIFSFSTLPLALASILGILFCFLSFLLGLVVALKTIFFGDPVAGFPTLFCMLLFIGGIILLVIGIQGQYLSRMYMEMKRRPLYIIKEKQDIDSK